MYIKSQFSWAIDDSQLLQMFAYLLSNVLCEGYLLYVSVKKCKSQPSMDSHTVSSTKIVREPPADLLSISSAVAKDVQTAVQNIDKLI